MEQLKAYALRKHFFRILNDEGIENAYHFLIQHPPMVDNLSKVYQNSKDEAYILQLNRLNETELLQSQNEISMLLIHAPWNLSLWRLFANTFSDKKVSLKQEILWFIAIKQDNRHGYLQFVNVIRGARRWNLEAIYAQLKLIELSKFKQNHLQQVEFLAQKTYFELDELSRQGEKVRRITTLFSKLVKIPDYKVLLRETPYFCSFCYFHLGDIKKALAFITINFNTRDQVLMINQLLYYDYVNEGRDLLETLIKNDSVSSPPLIEFFRTQIKAATEGEAMVKPLMIWLKRYPKRVSITLIEESEDALQSHPNQPLVSLCLKHLCNVFIGDQAAQTLYMKSLEWLQDT
ncbi:MAG TPA: hypothetical protein DCY20_06745, partial [Firmicutes bacterium]|nr:hypothetical protein [Bacillota bacterium]